VTHNDDLTVKGSTVLNEDGLNEDFRVESVNNTDAILVDADQDKVGLFTNSLSTAQVTVGNDLALKLGSSIKKKYIGKYVDYRSVGDGTYRGYLLLVPFNSGAPAVGAAMQGNFIAHRGDSGAANSPATCEVFVSGVYTNTRAWFKKEGANEYFQNLVRVIYAGVEYLSLEFSNIGGGPVNGIYFDGWALREDNNFLFMARDTEVTVVSSYATPYEHIDSTGTRLQRRDIQMTDRNSTIGWPDGTGGYNTFIGATNHVSGGFGAATDTYWNLLSSAGGTHVVLNTDGTRTSGRTNYDHFTVWQKAPDQTNGRLAFSVDNSGQAFFGAAGVGIDRQWANYPSITVYRDGANGDSNAALSEFRVHGANITTAWWHGGATGADFGVNFRIDGSTYISSDRRKKSDITTITNALDTVKQLEGKRFQVMNSDGSVFNEISDTGYKLGFIAQEVEQVVPDAVRHYTEEDDGTEGYNNAYSVDYASMVPLLTNAIKEQQAIIEALQERITALESN